MSKDPTKIGGCAWLGEKKPSKQTLALKGPPAVKTLPPLRAPDIRSNTRGAANWREWLASQRDSNKST